MHFYDFITDDQQYYLKTQATQQTKSGRFEDTILEYKRIFLEQFEQIDNNAPSQLLSQDLSKNPDLTEWFNCCLNVIKQDQDQFVKLFDEVSHCFDLFLRSKHYLSVLKMHDLLEHFELLIPVSHIKIGAFYRGRPVTLNGRTGTVVEKLDCRAHPPYKHLPFSKRNLVNNQRFSFAGVPILYLGNSVMTVYYELRETNLNSKKIGVSQFGCNQLAGYDLDYDIQRVIERQHYFDITNDIFELVNNVFHRIIKDGYKIPVCDAKGSFPGTKNIIIAFRRLILSQLCTFTRTHGSPFVAEYLIPQILTEAIKIHKFDGILFPSTQFTPDRNIEIRSAVHDPSYKYNLAVFTEYHPLHDYDVRIEENFHFTVIDFSAHEEIDTAAEIQEIENDLKKATEHLKFRIDGEHHFRTSILIENIKRKIELYKSLFISNVNYLETFAGKMEIRYLLQYLDQSIGKALRHIPKDDNKIIAHEQRASVGNQ